MGVLFRLLKPKMIVIYVVYNIVLRLYINK